MIGLAGQVSGQVVVDAVLDEGGVAQVAPEHGRHAQLVGRLEGNRDLLDLAVGLGRAEVDGGAQGDGAQLPGLFHRAEDDLVVFVGIGEELVVVDLADEWDSMRVFARHRAEHAEG